ncbi:MAG: DUF721 domain-containing protein [Betaproteobacteria bacterium]|nr:DUF721 domain-containing protein [Betaproteobacteria bacterium]
MQARTLNSCLNADETMARLAAHAGRLLKLQRLFQTAVPTALAQTCRVANYRLGVVFIHAENGAVAAKLRQISPSICEVFGSGGEQVTEIQVKVQPSDAASHNKPRPKAAVLDDASRDSIRRLSTTLPEGLLREALGRLLDNSK